MEKGFSLIELLITMIIVAILVAIAYPSYTDYLRKSKRVEAQAELLDLASKIQRYKIANFTFLQTDGEPITLENIGESEMLTLPRSGNPLYQVTLFDVTEKTWTLAATPIDNTTQQLDGGVSVNYRGEKCWVKSQKNCIPSEETTWDHK